MRSGLESLLSSLWSPPLDSDPSTHWQQQAQNTADLHVRRPASYLQDRGVRKPLVVSRQRSRGSGCIRVSCAALRRTRAGTGQGSCNAAAGGRALVQGARTGRAASAVDAFDPPGLVCWRGRAAEQTEQEQDIACVGLLRRCQGRQRVQTCMLLSFSLQGWLCKHTRDFLHVKMCCGGDQRELFDKAG